MWTECPDDRLASEQGPGLIVVSDTSHRPGATESATRPGFSRKASTHVAGGSVPAIFRHDRVMLLTALPADMAARLRGAEFTYSEVGLTAGVLPPSYRHLHRTTLIGTGPEVFA